MTPPERLQQRVHLGAGHGLRGRLPPHRQRQRQLLHLRLHVRQLQVNPPPPLQTVSRVRADRLHKIPFQLTRPIRLEPSLAPVARRPRCLGYAP